MRFLADIALNEFIQRLNSLNFKEQKGTKLNLSPDLDKLRTQINQMADPYNTLDIIEIPEDDILPAIKKLQTLAIIYHDCFGVKKTDFDNLKTLLNTLSNPVVENEEVEEEVLEEGVVPIKDRFFQPVNPQIESNSLKRKSEKDSPENRSEDTDPQKKSRLSS